MSQQIKLFRVIGWLDLSGYTSKTHEYTVVEKETSFWGEGRRIKKEALLKIQTDFFENHTSIRYYCYCLDGDQKKVMDMLKAHITEKVKIYKSQIDILVGHMLTENDQKN